MARLQGRQIEALDQRTDASQTFVNPDGTLTYTAFAEPQWTKRGGTWATLDATLKQGSDGTVAPAMSEAPLSLSGGGRGPLASMTVDGNTVSLSWPTALPKPVLSGATATYRDVLPGVDLDVTATPAGGVEETLVVKSAAAAADPGLSSLLLSASTSAGVAMTADAGGNLTVKDAHDRALVTSPAPLMWDSSTPDTATTAISHSGSPAPVAGKQPASGTAADSTARGPDPTPTAPR